LAALIEHAANPRGDGATSTELTRVREQAVEQLKATLGAYNAPGWTVVITGL